LPGVSNAASDYACFVDVSAADRGPDSWWLKALLVAQAPATVFAELREDSRQAAEARQEVVAALAFLAGLALTLLTSQASSFADDPARAGIIIPVWLFIAGLLVGIVNYWLAGGILHLALGWLGGRSSYRQGRHLLALAAVPLALSLVLVPIRLALYGDDIFRTGGSDSGSGAHVFTGLVACFGLWALVLLAIGIRVVEGWTWPRAVSATALFGLLVALVDLALGVLGG
jgi:Yip1 domain